MNTKKYKSILSVLVSVILIFAPLNIIKAVGFDVSALAPYPYFSVANEEANPFGIAFNTDGTKMFVIGQLGHDVNEYTLSTAYGIGTASFVDAFGIGGQDAIPNGLAFNTDGTKMFVVGDDGNDINEYTLSTGFDVSTASFVDAFSVDSEETQPTGIDFNTDGTKMFVVGDAGNDVGEYTLSTGFDVSTASYVDAFDVANQDTAPRSIAFNPDGTRMFMVGDSGNDIIDYTLSTGFDVSTAFLSDSFTVLSEETQPTGIDFNTDGTKMFVIGINGDDVNEYTLSTAYNIVTASFVDSFSVADQDTSPEDLAFNTDGTKMFVVGDAGNDINEYTLSTGFDVSTASFVDAFSVDNEDSGPRDVAFNTDGTKMFVVGYMGCDINEYTLSAGFDVSTASYVDVFSVLSQEGSPSGVAFNTDGTKMFVTGQNGVDVNEYTLSTGFDVSTASYVDNFSVANQDTSPESVTFNTDGTKMFIIGDTTNRVYQYSIANTAPTVGHTSDNVLGTVTQDTDGTGKVHIPFRVKDAENNSVTTLDWQYSDDGGDGWNGLVAGDMTGEDGSKSSATDWTGTEHVIVWSSQNQIDDTNQNDIQFRFKVNDGTVNSTDYGTSVSFSVDNLNPSVSTLSPTDDATAVAITSNLEVSFDENVYAGTGYITLYKSDDTQIEQFDVTSDISGSGTDTITINPISNLASETGYYVQIDVTAFDDSAGNSFAGITDETTWSFTTGDHISPTVTSFSPIDGIIDVTINSDLVIIFSEVVDAESGNIVIYKSIDDSIFETIAVTSSQVSGTGTNTITIDPSDSLATETAYYVKIATSAFDDTAGNSFAGITDATTWNFVTIEGEEDNASVEIDNGNIYTTDHNVTVTILGTDTLSEVTEMIISENPNFTGSEWEDFSTTKSIILSDEDGIKAIYVRYRDSNGNVSEIFVDYIIVDTVMTMDIETVATQDYVGTQEDWETTDTTPAISGNAETNSTIEITIQSDLITASFDVGESGEWEWTPETALAYGDHTVTIVGTDLAGNTNTVTFALTVAEPAEDEPEDEDDETDEVIVPVEETEDIVDDKETEELAPTGSNVLPWGITGVCLIIFGVLGMIISWRKSKA